jgi:hypothetical protein
VDKEKIWRQLVDFKYNTSNPNLFTCRESGFSNFWKGVLWAAKVEKWGIGRGLTVGVRLGFGRKCG